MTFNALKFYKDYHIDNSDSGSKHCRKGWINIHCPFCHGNDYHLGTNLTTGAVKCWKCGNHSQVSVIQAVLDCDYPTAKELHEEYSEGNTKRVYDSKGGLRETRKEICQWPTGTGPLLTRHRAYLARRGFNAELLEQVWGLRGTDNLGDYKFRIIAPIYINGVMVSYQGRDVTERSSLRYKACAKENEVIDHQNVVYGLDLVKGDSCVTVEGIADCWRMGPGSVSCFGTAFTLAQVNLLAARFKRVYILFDADDDNASSMARALAVALSARGVLVEILDISDTPPECLVDPEKGIDPGNLQQWYADQIMEELEL